MFQFIRKQALPILLLVASFAVLAQENRNYSGPMQVGNYTGKGDYQYSVTANDTVYDGPFQIQRSSLEALLEKKDVSFLFKGSFDKGIPNGNWQFQFGEFQTESKSQVVGYEYRVLISGLQEEGIGTVRNGRPDGQWSYSINKIKDSEIEKTLFKSSLTFENGIPQQNFQIENDSSTVVGRFLRDGLAHDEWSSFSENAIDNTESWFFEEGVLKQIRTTKDGIISEMPIFKASENYKTIRINERFLNLLKAVVASNAHSIDTSTGIADLLLQNERSYQKIDSVFNHLGATGFLPALRVKVPFYPLDSSATKTVNAISEDVSIAKSIGQELLTNSHLNIVRRSDPNIEYKYQVVKAISERFLAPLAKLNTYKEQDIIDYIDVSKMLGQLWPNGKPSTAVSVSGNEKVFRLSNASEYNFESDNLESFRRLAEYAKLSMIELKNSMSGQLKNEQRLQQLNGLEEDLIKANDSMVKKIDSVSPGMPKDLKKALEKIKALSERSLRDYAAMENPQEKLAFGTALKACFNEFSELTTALFTIPETNEEILTLYQDAIWNPFMATVMDEEVKKRITTSYSKILIPYFINGVVETLSCENAEDWKNQIIHTNKRMRELREADTKKLERKLRREKGPEAILKLLHQRTSED